MVQIGQGSVLWSGGCGINDDVSENFDSNPARFRTRVQGFVRSSPKFLAATLMILRTVAATNRTAMIGDDWGAVGNTWPLQSDMTFHSVIPARAGIQFFNRWLPVRE
jgi:hypothetical protein